MHGHLKRWAEMDISTPVLSLKYIAKVRDYDNHPCKKFLKDQDHRSINRTSFMHSNLFQKIHLIALLCCFLFNYLLCMVLFVIELTLISINEVYIYIYISDIRENNILHSIMVVWRGGTT